MRRLLLQDAGPRVKDVPDQPLTVLHHAKHSTNPDRLRAWAVDRERACGHNKAAIALANKLAQTVWAVWAKEENYQSFPARAGGNV